MKRVIVNIILIIVYIILTVVIVLPFFAELNVEKAEAFEKGYRWGNADKMYKEALRIYPFNAEYVKKYGDFLTIMVMHQKDKVAALQEAQGMYERGLRLNPRNGEYWYLVGKSKLEIFFVQNHENFDTDSGLPRRTSGAPRNDSGDDKIKEAMSCFRRAVENDPNGFNTLYSVCNSGIELWKYLDEYEKKFILHVLKRNIALSPQYNWKPFIEYIYQKVWNLEKNFRLLKTITPDNLLSYSKFYWFIVRSGFLMEFRKEQADMLIFYRKKEELEEFEKDKKEKEKRLEKIRKIYKDDKSWIQWQGIADNGKNEYKNGRMYWTGTVDKAIDIPKGKIVLKIKAKSSSAYGIWPYMIVSLDGEEIGEVFVDSPKWKEYDFEVKTDGGIKVLSITYPNDKVVARKGVREDRNLYVGEVRVVGKE